MTNNKTQNQIQDTHGFSLVELVVVVAIIGILTGIAIPNFRLSQARTKTSEAKTNLSSLYTVEATSLVEQQNYSACLSDIGYTPFTTYYTVGFNTVGSNCALGATTGQSCQKTFSGGAILDCSKASPNYVMATQSMSGPPAPLGTISSLNQNTFTAEADGNITNTKTDIWTIDNNHNLTQTQQGY